MGLVRNGSSAADFAGYHGAGRSWDRALTIVFFFGSHHVAAGNV